MDLKVISSGSKGNTVAIVSGSSVLLVDLGLPKTKAERLLLDNGIAFKNVCGVLVSHAHLDHCRGLSLADKYNVKVFASEGTFKSIETSNSRVIKKGEVYEIECFEFQAFETHHDDYESFGYTITDRKGKKASVVFDTGKVTNEMIQAMRDSDIYCIEANHDPTLVESSSYPLSVQGRILSDIGHLSNEQTAAALKRLIRGKGERIYLTHLSNSNNTAKLAEQTVKLALFEKGFIKGKHYTLEVK